MAGLRAGMVVLALGVAGVLAGCGDHSGGASGATHPGHMLGAARPGPIVVAPQAAAQCGNADLSGIAAAIYVSSRGADHADCGQTIANACRTVQQGIDRCGAAGCAVLVRHGLYVTTSSIVLRDGVSVYGGCRFDDEADRRYRTVIRASPAPGAAAIVAQSIGSRTIVHGLVVVGKNESASGTACLAMVVGSSSGLTIQHTVLAAGRGGDGAPGASATTPAGAGGRGGDAVDTGAGTRGLSCPAQHLTDDGDGGYGWMSGQTIMAGCFNWTGNDDPSQGSGAQGAASGSVAGGAAGPNGSHGLWCDGRPSDAPGDGGPGGPGGSGACGRQTKASPLAAGSFDAATWMRAKGDDGQAGAVGSGGGGGGAGGTCGANLFALGYQGLAGGGGGGGGCGGGAGMAGQQGGASIPLVLASSAVTLTGNAIVPGPAGRGGAGGHAASGGPGGPGGGGVRSGQSLYWAHWCGGLGSSGGAGGAGGSGSGGAGGNGGPSFGIALVGTSPTPAGRDGIHDGLPGQPGEGGLGGPGICVDGVCSSCTGPDGEGGVPGASAAWIRF